MPHRGLGIQLLGRLYRSLFASVLTLAVLVVGHNLHFLLQYGSGYASAMARGGDGSSWDETVRFVIAAAILLTMVAGLRLAFLLRQVRRSFPGRRVTVTGLSWGGYLRTVGPIWVRLFSASLLLFVLQENFERWGSGLGLPGIGAIGTVGLGSPVLVFALVSLAFAMVVALFRLGIDRLEALIAEARNRSWHGVSRVDLSGRSDPESRQAPIIARNLAGRAPPMIVQA